jgi:hypothetical protein
MNPSELEILEQIEVGLSQEDADFVERIAGGPRLSGRYKAAAAAATIAGIALVLLFSVNLILGVAGYMLLVAAGTSMLRRRPLKPAEVSPLETFHRLSAGLFRNTTTVVESGLD